MLDLEVAEDRGLDLEMAADSQVLGLERVDLPD
jgi:hypothetical protein